MLPLHPSSARLKFFTTLYFDPFVSHDPVSWPGEGGTL